MELVKTVLKVTTQKSISINEFESFQRRLERMKIFILDFGIHSKKWPSWFSSKIGSNINHSTTL